MIDVYKNYRITCQNVKSNLNSVEPTVSTCHKCEEDIVPLTPRPRWRHQCILAADYLHSTAAGTIHLAHSEDESIHHIQK